MSLQDRSSLITYLKERDIGTITRQLNYIYCLYGMAAVIIKQGNTETLYYTETDHPGSIIGLINDKGTCVEKNGKLDLEINFTI